MKESFKLWKSWIVLSAIAGFLVTCWVVVYAATSVNLSSYKTGSLPNAEGSTTAKALSASKWNALMTTLETLNCQGQGGGESIPDWMIAAFYGGCPSWWSQYSQWNVPGDSLHVRTWCKKWEPGNGSCYSELCWTVANWSTCTTYATNVSDVCERDESQWGPKRVSTCYDGEWDKNPYPDWYVQHWYTSCSAPQWWWGGGSSSCSTSYNRPPCPSPYTSEQFVHDNGEWKVYNCNKSDWSYWCQVYKCKNTSCLFYQWHCYYADSSKPAGVNVDAGICPY